MTRNEIITELKAMRQTRTKIEELEVKLHERERAVSRIGVEERKIYEVELAQLLERYIKLEKAISSLEGREEYAIRQHYVLGKSTYAISKESGYCERQVWRILRAAVSNMEAAMT